MREMTLAEKIQSCIIQNCPALLCSDPHLAQIKAITDLIQSAIAREREECELIAEIVRKREVEMFNGKMPYHTIAEEIRDRIRARSQSALLVLPESEKAIFGSEKPEPKPVKIYFGGEELKEGETLTVTAFPASILTTEDPRQTESDMLASVGIRMQPDMPECENKAPERSYFNPLDRKYHSRK